MAVTHPGSGTEAPPFWAETETDLYERLGASADGLTSAAALERLAAVGPNRVGGDPHAGNRVLLLRQFANPIMLLLVGATLLSMFLGDAVDAGIILAIVLASSVLGFVQERGAVDAVRALQSSVQIHADILRDGEVRDVALDDVVPGDVVVLDVGDVIPGDCRVLSSDGLTVDESTLTGESYPVHKTPGTQPGDAPIRDRRNCVFLGSHVVSGSGRAIVAATGASTELGRIGTSLSDAEPPTSFERGLYSFGYLLMRIGGGLIAVVLAVNLLLHRPALESLLFALALAVGITPQLLPAIVTVTLARGARAMAAARVVVKRLSSIEDLGGMQILCVDKTGTLTAGSVQLEAALDVDGAPSTDVAVLAWLNAHHQRGFTNPIDAAILANATPPADPGRRIGELSYDFTRQRLSVAVEIDGRRTLIAKGSLRSIREVCTRARRAGNTDVVAITEVDTALDELFQRLSNEGLRVLAVAVRDLDDGPAHDVPLTVDDERDLVLVGLLTFADPVKEGVDATIAELADLGVSVRMLTGDNRHVAAHVAAGVGLPTDRVMLGRDLDALDDDALRDAALSVAVFAEVEPPHKERIIRCLTASGRTTGFLGDGINDAMALRSADVGISVDTAVDVAKESAAIVLLNKDLRVLLDGVRRGRQNFANTLKYVFVTTSANFGNMVSMAGAAIVLPFVPLLPRQILLLNLLSDIPGTTIATDSVDDELVQRPTSWNIAFIRRFMVVFGLVSSAFDYLTFAVLRFGFDAPPSLFRTGWFLTSVGTELAVMLVLRTRRPFVQSRPGRALVLSSVVVAALTFALPFSPLADALGLAAPSMALLVALAGILVGYVVASEVAKAFFYRVERD